MSRARSKRSERWLGRLTACAGPLSLKKFRLLRARLTKSAYCVRGSEEVAGVPFRNVCDSHRLTRRQAPKTWNELVPIAVDGKPARAAKRNTANRVPARGDGL